MSDTTQAALARIEAGIEAVRDSARFREYLACCGRFHSYSFANQMLIWSQRPTASIVAGFRTWLSLNRYVRKGEKGIMILAPIVGKRRADPNDEHGEDGAEDEQTFRAFRPVYVFDISQTEGEALPEPNQLLTGADHGIWERLAALAANEGLSLTRESRPEIDANGFYVRSERQIWVSPDLEPLQAAKTLAHELAHHFANHQESGHTRSEAEMIAESSAFIVMAHFGQDSGDYSFGYLASWGDTKTFKAKLQEIHSAAGAIIKRTTGMASMRASSSTNSVLTSQPTERYRW